MTDFGGWTGKTLRVNLSTAKISTEDTIAKYKDYLGGTGVGYKVLWDEVPAKTRSFDEANKIILGAGPLTGTSAPCGGRVSITTIYPTVHPVELVASGHMGGHWGPELKYAGWDNIIIEGKSDKPVYIAVVDDMVEIRDASHLWRNGIYRHCGHMPGNGPRDTGGSHRPGRREHGPNVVCHDGVFPFRGRGRGGVRLQETQGHCGSRDRRRQDCRRQGDLEKAQQVHPLAHGSEQPACCAKHPTTLGRILFAGQPLDREERAFLGSCGSTRRNR
jgi:Aldehyde ferredoxin oxidoreductase, N-terminal domain